MLRENTEWVETLHGDWNILVGAEREKLQSALFPLIVYGSFLSGASRKMRDIFHSSYYNQDNVTVNFLNDFFKGIF
jgi:hypothetical protein